MTGDVKIELTITADAVERFFSLLGFLKERTEETREKTTEEIPPITPKEDNKKENKEEKKESNISSCYYVDGDVGVEANKPAIKPIANNIANKVSNSSNTDSTGLYPPTVEEIDEYAKSKNYDLNAYRFFAYYSKRGWCDKNGNRVIPVWKETIDYWMHNEITKKDVVMQPVDKSKREELRATHPFTPTDF